MTDRVERFEMQANFDGLVQLLARNLYSAPDAFVRELVQNAHDAIRLRARRQPRFTGRIEIETRPDRRELVFRDDGLGMSRRDIRQFLSVIGSSGTGEATARLAALGGEGAEALIGRFGIGLLSAFLVAERVEVRTRKLGARRGLHWENDGSAACLLRETDVEREGTEVLLRVAPAHTHMLGEEAILRALIRYADFIPEPIHLNGTGPVNTMQAPWHRPLWSVPARREPELRSFVERRFPDVPLEVIPIDLDEPVRAQGVLLIIHNRIPDFNSAGVMDVYVRRMFVRSAHPELLPSWAKFVRGVIDSPDLQPNAARDDVRQDDAVLRALREALGRLILERLTHLATHEPERMAQLCRWHHFHLKGIALADDAFFDRVAELLAFDTNRGPTCLRELLRAPASVEESGAATVHYVSARGAAAQYFRMAEGRGWSVIDAGKPLDEALLRKFADRNPDRISLVALDGDEESALFERLSADEGARFRRLEVSAERGLRGAGFGAVVVKAARFDPTNGPTLVLATPRSEADHQLEALSDAAWITPELGELTRRVARERVRPVRLIMNVAHPAVRGLAAAIERGEETESRLVCLTLAAFLHSRKLLTDRNTDVFCDHLVRVLSESTQTMAPQALLPGLTSAVG